MFRPDDVGSFFGKPGGFYEFGILSSSKFVTIMMSFILALKRAGTLMFRCGDVCLFSEAE